MPARCFSITERDFSMRSTLRTLMLASFTLLAACPSNPRTTDGGPGVDAAHPLDTGVIGDSGGMCTTPSTEDTTAACSDGCDNDGNSFVDCNDFSCCTFRTDCPSGTACGDRGDAGMAATYTIAQIQNRADAMHPAPMTRVSVTQAGMVALTGRVLVGSASGGASMSCRFAVWVGAPVSGDFSAIQVQEIIDLPTGVTSCFDDMVTAMSRISDSFAPGDAVTSINNATYNEFCASAAGTTPVPCTDFEQSNIFLGGSATIVRGAAGTAPAGTVVGVSDVVGAAGIPGARSVALEGTLLQVEDVRIGSRMDGTFTQYYAFVGSAPTVQLDLVVSNFPNTSCVRDALTALAAGTTTVPTITGVLLPNFGRWSLRVRDEADIGGVTCP
jgi:hypothetical protein